METTMTRDAEIRTDVIDEINYDPAVTVGVTDVTDRIIIQPF